MIPVSVTAPGISQTIPLSQKARSAVFNIVNSEFAPSSPGCNISYDVGGTKFVFEDVPQKAIEYIMQVHQAGAFV